MPNGSRNDLADPGGSPRRAEFESLYALHSREVWALAYARWMDSDLAMDITQEAFLRLWKQWEAAEEIQNPRAWLLRVARNLAEDYAKSAFRRNGTQPPELLNGVRSSQPMPIEKLERDELFARLREVLDELAPPDREILTLRYALDYDANAIAERLDIAVTAVHMRLSRARQRLAERLSSHGDFAPGDNGRATRT
ncbi:MAG: sigma-70 family RNA polymerase sigma factor [Isosphaera sp.]|jgi:RNA polymerase sigma-70 factor, ECF subfamily|nr:sigma-70 family RNA polymerase sigma factor [Isosphaera sp.]